VQGRAFQLSIDRTSGARTAGQPFDTIDPADMVGFVVAETLPQLHNVRGASCMARKILAVNAIIARTSEQAVP